MIDMEVTLEKATAASDQALAELLELYVKELSEIFAVAADADGRFRYHKLPLYWDEPERRFAFFIRSGDQRVGFALATRGSPAAEESDCFDVAEFFVLDQHRHGGVGRQAAYLLWDRLPGHWIVRVSERNVSALSFWHKAVREYTGGAFSVTERPEGWRVFGFRSPRAPATM